MTSFTIGEPHETQAFFSRFPQNSGFRLFTPSNSDDLSHDEALSSRIAALNLLDLSLENLGVDIDPSAVEEMRNVIKACGDSRSPRDSDAEYLFIAVQLSPSLTPLTLEDQLRSPHCWSKLTKLSWVGVSIGTSIPGFNVWISRGAVEASSRQIEGGG